MRYHSRYLCQILLETMLLTNTNFPLLRKCKQNLHSSQMLQNNLTGNSASSTRMSKCFLTEMTAQTKISVLTGPKQMKKRTKSATREKGFKILFMIRSKKHSIEDQVRLEHIFTISCRNREQDVEILKRYLLVNLTRTLLLHDSLQTKWR